MTASGLDSLYRRLVTLVVLRSGLGNPTDPAVLQEANNCLATVFPVSQLVNFQGMARIEKKTKLRQLTSLVKGLRIYNWDCGRGGAGVDHLPSILTSAAEATRNNLTSLARHTRHTGRGLLSGPRAAAGSLRMISPALMSLPATSRRPHLSSYCTRYGLGLPTDNLTVLVKVVVVKPSISLTLRVSSSAVILIRC